MSGPQHGIRITLERCPGGSDAMVAYDGQIEVGERRHPLVARVTESESAPDGLRAEASIEGLAEREGLERVVATMVRSAVRSARKDGRPPPRRIRRWRA